MGDEKDLPPKAVIQELGEVELQELDGSTTRLDSLWQKRAAAFYFLRHYG